jgi:galactokinase/mevalonate kinase-like predicted kinase
LWQVEAVSVLLKAEKKAQISAADTARIVSSFEALSIQMQSQMDIPAVSGLGYTPLKTRPDHGRS